MFKFTKDSAIVKAWVTLILAGVYTLEQVPKLFNLKEIVKSVLEEVNGEPTHA